MFDAFPLFPNVSVLYCLLDKDSLLFIEESVFILRSEKFNFAEILLGLIPFDSL